MRILFGSDEKTVLTDAIISWLNNNNHEVTLVGHLAKEESKWHWAEIGREIGKRVGAGEFDFGIGCCWSGTGVCMAANKEQNTRAILAWDAETARLGKKWDNANILCFSLRYTSESLSQEMLEAFFKEPFNEETLDQVKYLNNN